MKTVLFLLLLLLLMILPACEAANVALNILAPEPAVKTPCDLYDEARSARVVAENRVADAKAKLLDLSARGDRAGMAALAPQVDKLIHDLRVAQSTEETLWRSCPPSARRGG